MFDVFEGIRSLLKLEEVCIDNNIFRLHYKGTMIILLIFSVINTSRQYIGDPIDCVADGVSQSIMDTYCWITSTFTVPGKFGRIGLDVVQQGVSHYVPVEDEVKHHKYYQWVCFVLFFQAIFFYVPRYLWKIWEGGRIRALAQDLKNISLDQPTMNERCKTLCKYFERNVYHHNVYFLRFVFCEILNLLNVVGQMFLMDRFLDYEFSTYGWDVVNFTNTEYEQRIDPMSEIFPKVAKCTFHKYGPSGTIEAHDGLCILPINVVNEKMYIFLWFWFLILAGITLLAIIYRFAFMLSRKLRFALLRSRFRIASKDDIEYLNKKFKIGDWFIFYQISGNVDHFVFNKLITDLSKCMKEKDEKMMNKDKAFSYTFIKEKV